MATCIMRVANDKKRDTGRRKSNSSWLNLNTLELWNRIATSQCEFLPVEIHARAFQFRCRQRVSFESRDNGNRLCGVAIVIDRQENDGSRRIARTARIEMRTPCFSLARIENRCSH